VKIEGGYFFNVTEVDCTTGTGARRPLDPEFVRTYVGGRGFAARLVADNFRPGLSPLSPDNLIVIAPGPLTGLYLPASGKTSFAFLSPATGLYGDSNMGGVFGVELRQSGTDALAIRGRAAALSYLFVDDDEVRVIPCPKLKGATCLETEGAICDELGDNEIRVASIGVAGENLVKIACVTTDLSRNAGRCGVGAVLGSKNIKAVAVRGTHDLPVADLARLVGRSEQGFRELRDHHLFRFWQQQGLMSVVDYVNTLGVMPTRNFRDGQFPAAERINGFVMEEKYKIGDANCYACPMCCSNVCLIKDGRWAGTVVEGPEYETACMYGSNLGVDDFAVIIKANSLCDQLGIDTISSGALIAAAIEGFQAGIIPAEDFGGLKPAWGDPDFILPMIERICRREGIGDTLAGGARAVIERWPALRPIVSQVKGLEQSAYDARVAITMALGYGTSDIGAHHSRAWPIARELEQGMNWGLEEKADLVIYHQTVRPLFDMLGVCRLPWIELGFDERQYADYYSAVTGVDTTFDELLGRSRAIYDLTRTINVSLGVRRQDDLPPERVFEVPIETGPFAGRKLDRDEYERLLSIYYEKRGWSPEGLPPGVETACAAPEEPDSE